MNMGFFRELSNCFISPWIQNQLKNKTQKTKTKNNQPEINKAY